MRKTRWTLVCDYATCNLSFTFHFSIFELWSLYLDHSEMGTMFSIIPTITFEASISIDVLDLLAIAGSSLLCDHQRQPRTSSHYAATCSSHAFGHLPLSQVFRPKSAGFSHPGTFAMVGSRRATASCTHKTWVWRCLTRHAPRLEAIAFDAVASHSYTWLDHLCHVSSHGHFAKSSRSTLGQRGYARPASRTKTKSTVGSSCIPPSRCL